MRAIVILFVLTSFAACQAIPTPTVRPDRFYQDWVLEQDLVYRIGTTSEEIVVPAGFVTDFASIPAFARPALSSTDLYSSAAVVHDFLYWTQSCSKGQADNIFLIAMQESDVGFFWRNVIYGAVRTPASQAAWDRNRALRAQGLPKVFPSEFREEFTQLGAEEAQRVAKTKGVEDPPFDSAPSYCALGDTSDVPTG